MKNYKNYSELPLAMNAKDVMMALGLSRAGVYNLLKETDFPSMKVGSRIIVPKDKFINWMNKKVGEKDGTI